MTCEEVWVAAFCSMLPGVSASGIPDAVLAEQIAAECAKLADVAVMEYRKRAEGAGFKLPLVTP